MAYGLKACSCHPLRETGIGCNTGHGATVPPMPIVESDYKFDFRMDVHLFLVHVPAKSVFTPLGLKYLGKKQKQNKTYFFSG